MNKQKKYWWDYFAVVSILGENWRVSRLSKEQEQEKLEMMENDTQQRLYKIGKKKKNRLSK